MESMLVNSVVHGVVPPVNVLELCGLSPRANYTDRAAAAGRRS